MEKSEDVYRICDYKVDDFVMFRYELNSIFKKHNFTEEGDTDLFFGGKHPLSKFQGIQLKDLSNEEKKAHLDLYRPPGLIES